VNGDKVYNESNDRMILGNGLPEYIFGLTNNFTFRGFDLAIFFQGVQGNKVYNITRTSLETSDPSTNFSKVTVNDHWTQTNPSSHTHFLVKKTHTKPPVMQFLRSMLSMTGSAPSMVCLCLYWQT